MRYIGFALIIFRAIKEKPPIKKNLHTRVSNNNKGVITYKCLFTDGILSFEFIANWFVVAVIVLLNNQYTAVAWNSRNNIS